MRRACRLSPHWRATLAAVVLARPQVAATLRARYRRDYPAATDITDLGTSQQGRRTVKTSHKFNTVLLQQAQRQTSCVRPRALVAVLSLV